MIFFRRRLPGAVFVQKRDSDLSGCSFRHCYQLSNTFAAAVVVFLIVVIVVIVVVVVVVIVVVVGVVLVVDVAAAAKNSFLLSNLLQIYVLG